MDRLEILKLHKIVYNNLCGPKFFEETLYFSSAFQRCLVPSKT